MIWLLKLDKKLIDWGVMASTVIRANTEKTARKIASKNCYGEGKKVWLDSSKTSCELLSEDSEEALIIKNNID